MAVEARASSAQGKACLRALKADAAQLLCLLGLDECELSLLLCNDEEIRRLNRDFRGKDKATDVLSFEQEENRESFGDGGGMASRSRPSRGRLAIPPGRQGGADMPLAYPRLLGDIVISIDTAARQASALGQIPRERLRTLLIHGVLHLIGYDHERSAAEARRMFARERKLASALPPATGSHGRRLPLAGGAEALAHANVAGTGAAHKRGSRPSPARDMR
ncbi:MAG: rRNA maturation RNase YbeY [Candidatus Binataceae bacterium]|jgi:probable rRNA maturation factor